MGKRVARLDGVMKASGRAKYSYDIARPGMLYGVIVTCPHAHAKLTGIDTSAAEKSRGVAAVEIMTKPGEEIQWAGYEIVAIAAETEELALDAARKVKAEYEVLPHFVNEQDLKNAGKNAKQSGEQVTGDPDAALKEAEVTSEGFYGVPVLNHCALESHGQVVEWKGDQMEYWPSTQNVAGIGGDLAKALEFPAANVHTHMDVVGGAFGSKFSPDRWGEACARMSKKAGGRPVKLFLDRSTELAIAGNRPSFYAKVKTGAKKDGSLILWDAQTWGTGGFGGVASGDHPNPWSFQSNPCPSGSRYGCRRRRAQRHGRKS
jgi:xanthine dehydrogenase YagR molybdenum-binding subunit